MARFIVIEGLDGAGTTTQAERVAAALVGRGLPVTTTREPTDGPVGRLIRATLRGDAEAPAPEVLPWLFAADRADHLGRTVQPALRAGTWVVSDRYLHSSLAYQSLTLPLERVFSLNADFRAPDLTLFLEVPVEVCLRRIGDRGGERDIYEAREQLERIEAGYRAALELLAARGDRIVPIDGTATPDQVEQACLAAIEAL